MLGVYLHNHVEYPGFQVLSFFVSFLPLDDLDGVKIQCMVSNDICQYNDFKKLLTVKVFYSVNNDNMDCTVVVS